MAASLLLAASLPYRQAFPLPGLAVPDGWGVNIHFTDPKPGELEKMAGLGIKWVRMDLTWSSIEKARGQYDFSAYDRLTGALKKNGLRPVFILDYGNGLYEEGAPKEDASQEAFVRFARAAVQRYRGTGVVWEMWNEPNLVMFWQPKPSAELYSRLANRVGDMIRAEAPDEWLVGPASSGFDWSFLEDVFKRGVLKRFDAVTVHPYRQTRPETAESDWLRLRTLIGRYGEGRKIPMLSGEWGYSEAWPGQTPLQKADYVARQYLSCLASGAGLCIYYDWKDDGPDPKEPEHRFGLLGQNLEDKPASASLSFIAKALNGWTYASSRSTDSLQALFFKKGSQVKEAVWATRPGVSFAPASLLPAGEFTLERASEKTKVKGPFRLTSGPAIITPHKADPWLAALAGFPPVLTVMSPSEAAGGGVKAWLDKAALAAGKYTVWTGVDEPSVTQSALGILDAKGGGRARLLSAAAKVGEAGQPLSLFLVLSQATGSPGTESARLRIDPPRPLSLEPGATPDTQILQNPTGWKGVLDLDAAGRSRLDVTGEPTQALPERKGGYSLFRRGFCVAASPRLRTMPFLKPEQELTVSSEGDVKAENRLDGEPGSAGLHDLEVRFPDGWCYTLVKPKDPVLIPKEATAYGLEVYGDGSGSILRSRFRTADGQTFQPNGLAIDWTGWRLVRFALSAENAGWWGGRADGVIRGSVWLDSLLLIDSAKRLASTARIKFRNPHVVVRILGKESI